MSELSNIFKQQGNGPYVEIGEDENTIKFHIQEGPIKEVGENGCQVDMMIYLAATIIRSFNSHFPCRDNSCAITHLDEALMWLEKRTRDREKRKFEGKNIA